MLLYTTSRGNTYNQKKDLYNKRWQNNNNNNNYDGLITERQKTLLYNMIHGIQRYISILESKNINCYKSKKTINGVSKWIVNNSNMKSYYWKKEKLKKTFWNLKRLKIYLEKNFMNHYNRKKNYNYYNNNNNGKNRKYNYYNNRKTNNWNTTTTTTTIGYNRKGKNYNNDVINNDVINNNDNISLKRRNKIQSDVNNIKSGGGNNNNNNITDENKAIKSSRKIIISLPSPLPQNYQRKTKNINRNRNYNNIINTNNNQHHQKEKVALQSDYRSKESNTESYDQDIEDVLLKEDYYGEDEILDMDIDDGDLI
uniref:Uncharacterized protein n=1 Tax=Metapenaeus joyneri majanivirus TaxID=2984280 RepID=A0A9C7BWE9_9VIRU|nr:MAG: hypothetical protein [Metapenaeus joyneri majanivirus]